MNRMLLSLALSAAISAAPAQAGPLEDRIELLFKQVQELQGQVSQLRSMLNRDGTGKVVVTSTASRNDLVGTDFSTSVGRSLALAVGQSRSTEIGVDDLLTVTGGSTSNIGGSWRLNVNGDAAYGFGRSTATTIGQSRTTQIGANDLLTVTGNSTSNVGGSWNLNINGNATQRVTNSLSVAAAREILLQAGDQITLKTGSASIVMRKNGEITITGTTIRVLGSGDVVIKGSKVLTN